MAADLLLAPVGAGKTEHILKLLIDLKVSPAGVFAPVWVLLPGSRQEDDFRQRLIDHAAGRPIFFNITFFSFYTLYAHLLDIAGIPQREVDNTVRLRLLRYILDDLKRGQQLQVFDQIADKPGFVRIVADFIYELKQNVVKPEDFSAAAERGSPKDRDLARIYSAYQKILLDKDLVDREGEGWLALTEVESKPRLGSNIALLIADGFDQFNPLQAQLLSLLATRAQRTLVTLPIVPGRETTVGRRFRESIQRLQGSGVFNVKWMDAVSNERRHSALRHLSEHSFHLGAAACESGGCLTLIEAPDPAQEVSAVMRQVKRLLLTGCQPDDILVAVRDWERYGAHLASNARVYGLPVALHYGEKLVNNPTIIALLNLLDVAANDFRRRDLIDVLRSPYFAVEGLSSEWVDKLERVSRAHLIIGGRNFWLESLDLAAVETQDDEGERQEALLTLAEADYLKHKLIHFFEAITPVEQGRTSDYIDWLETLIGSDREAEADEQSNQNVYSLHMIHQIRATAEDEAIEARDLLAMREFKNLLRGLYTAQNLFMALGLRQDAPTRWIDFISDLQAALGAASIKQGVNRAGQVLVTTVADARGLPHKHVFIPGLSEGIFPAPIPEDPLYLDSERQALTAKGIPLETQAERAADEGLFYELINLGRETLTLSRPTMQNGVFWPESHLWRAVRVLFSDSETIIGENEIRLGRVVAPEQVASVGEASLVVAQGMSQSILKPDVIGLYNWLVTAQPVYWGHIRKARQIELGRMLNRRFDAYSGVLASAFSRGHAAEALGAGHVWSASQFNDYGQCGFRFFAKRLLKLEKIEEPEAGMNAAQLGTLNHKILEDTYRRLHDDGATITPDYLEQAVTTLRMVATDVLADAPRHFGFRASGLWEQEKTTLLRKLETIVRLDFSEDSPINQKFTSVPRRPYLLETPFDAGSDQPVLLPINSEIGGIRVTGYIDRIDRQGDRVILIDYKTGSKTIPTKEMQRGRNFQMMLYLRVGENLLANIDEPDAPKTIGGGLFWHLRNGKVSGAIQMDKPEDQEALDEALNHLSQHIARGREGDFAAQPNKIGGGACSHYCEFNQFCRVSIMRRSRQGQR